MMKLVLKNQEEINVNYMNNVYSFMERRKTSATMYLCPSWKRERT